MMIMTGFHVSETEGDVSILGNIFIYFTDQNHNYENKHHSKLL